LFFGPRFVSDVITKACDLAEWSAADHAAALSLTERQATMAITRTCADMRL
jgi:hypothetical protein